MSRLFFELLLQVIRGAACAAFRRFGLGLFRQKPAEAARAVQGMVSMTIYLMLIPVLVHFAWNGPTAGWILPEMWTAFIALLAMIQVVIIAPLGLALMGMTAAVARYQITKD